MSCDVQDYTLTGSLAQICTRADREIRTGIFSAEPTKHFLFIFFTNCTLTPRVPFTSADIICSHACTISITPPRSKNVQDQELPARLTTDHCLNASAHRKVCGIPVQIGTQSCGSIAQCTFTDGWTRTHATLKAYRMTCSGLLDLERLFDLLDGLLD